MNIELQKRCELFIENKEVLKKSTTVLSSHLYPVSSNIYTSKNVAVDVDKLQECKKIIEAKTGFFSSFRGNGLLPILSLLALDENPAEKMERALALYKKLDKEFASSDFLPVNAMLLEDMVSEEKADEIINRGKSIYKLMKKEHPFITGSEDSIFAILLAFSDKKDEEIVADVEKIFKELKEDDIETNCKQTVALIFSLTEGDYLEKCNKLRDVLAELKRNDRKYSPYHEMGALAGLVLLPVDTHTMVQDMLEVDEFLSDKKDYGFLGFTKKERLSHAAMILSGYYSNNNNFTVEVGSLVSVIALIAVQEAALFGAIAAGVVVGAAH